MVLRYLRTHSFDQSPPPQRALPLRCKRKRIALFERWRCYRQRMAIKSNYPASKLMNVFQVWCINTLDALYSIYSTYDVGDVFCVVYSSSLETVFLGSQNTSIQVRLLSLDIKLAFMVDCCSGLTSLTRTINPLLISRGTHSTEITVSLIQKAQEEQRLHAMLQN